MLLSELLKNVKEYEWLGQGDLEIADIAIDSRKACPGCLYVCIPGGRVDRHAFAAQVVEDGAVALVVERALDIPVSQVLVKNSRQTLALLAAAFYGYPARELEIMGVTGTKGKTTTTYLIKSILEQHGEKIGLIGTMANLSGDRSLPQTLTTPDPMEFHGLLREMANDGCKRVVMEVSAHALELSKLEGVRFSIGLYTNLSQDHLNDFITMDNYRNAKKKLFTDAMVEQVLVNADDPWGAYMVQDYHGAVLTYGCREGQVRAEDIRLSMDGISYTLAAGPVKKPIRLHIAGEFNVYNSLAAAVACMQMGCSLETIARGLGAVKSVSGRVQRIETTTPYAVFVDYAHSPDSLEKILEVARSFVKDGKLTVVFGCGGERDTSKRPIMGAIAARMADNIIITSDNPRTENPEAILDMIEEGITGAATPYQRIADRRKAIHAAIDGAQPGDVIIIAGKGHETYQDIMGEKHHFDDREVVQEYLGMVPGK